MSIPGAQHIVHNLCQEVSGRLAWWREFHTQLQNVQRFLRLKEYRDRLVWTCVKDGPFCTQEGRFAHWHRTLYEQRWHETVAFVRSLSKLPPTQPPNHPPMQACSRLRATTTTTTIPYHRWGAASKMSDWLQPSWLEQFLHARASVSRRRSFWAPCTTLQGQS